MQVFKKPVNTWNAAEWLVFWVTTEFAIGLIQTGFRYAQARRQRSNDKAKVVILDRNGNEVN